MRNSLIPRARWWWLASALCVATAATQGFAQQPPPNREREGVRAAEENQAQAQAVAATEDSRRALPSDAEPSYEDVLANPDDVDLNYRFALGQIRRGELRGASATLERVLMVAPNRPSVRLLRALVLYRLDNLADAKRELETLKSLPLAPDLRSTAEAYEKQIDKRSKKTKFAGRLGLGFEYDTNRNAAPATGKALFLDTPLQLSEKALRRSDEALVTMAALEARRILPGAAGHEAFGGYNYYRQDQNGVDSLDLQAHSARAGALLRLGGYRLTPFGGFDNVSLARQTFLVSPSVGFNLTRKLASRLEGTLDGVYQYQDFRRTREVGVADDRNGPEWDLAFGANYDVRSDLRVNGTFGVVEKLAAQEYYAFRRYTLGVTPTMLLRRGAFLLAGVQAYYDRYAKPDTVISSKSRKDDIYRFRAVLGAPLALSGMLKDFVGTASCEYYHAESSLPNYSYDNTKIMLLMNYKWEASR